MLISVTVKDISNGYLIQYSDPGEVLFKDGGSEVFVGSWDKITPHIEYILAKFKKKAR